ncbi:hypothetical protein X975_00725, partial [Stegodyphus mimosarum]
MFNIESFPVLTMLQLIFIVMTIASTISSPAEGATILEPKRLMKRGDTVRLCGRMLVETLSLLCDGEYYDPNEGNTRGKRNFGAEQVGIDTYPQWLAVALMSRNQLEASQISPGLPPFNNRGSRGVADECCKKACSIRTLLSYCRSVARID